MKKSILLSIFSLALGFGGANSAPAQGYSQANNMGGYNYYGSSGQYQGQSTGNNTGGYNYYGSSGQSSGYSTGNNMGGQNFYNPKNGNGNDRSSTWMLNDNALRNRALSPIG